MKLGVRRQKSSHTRVTNEKSERRHTSKRIYLLDDVLLSCLYQLCNNSLPNDLVCFSQVFLVYYPEFYSFTNPLKVECPLHDIMIVIIAGS